MHSYLSISLKLEFEHCI